MFDVVIHYLSLVGLQAQGLLKSTNSSGQSKEARLARVRSHIVIHVYSFLLDTFVNFNSETWCTYSIQRCRMISSKVHIYICFYIFLLAHNTCDEVKWTAYVIDHIFLSSILNVLIWSKVYHEMVCDCILS